MEYNAEIKLFADCHCGLTETPMWNRREQKLYWRDLKGNVYRKGLDSPPEEYEKFPLNIGIIGGMAFTDTDTILLFGENGKIWSWKAYTAPVICRDFQKGGLFNDCLVDPMGRIYCGMLTENYFGPGKAGEYGSFWMIDTDGTFTCIEDRIGPVPNGLRFSPDLKKLYLAESSQWIIYCYDYDIHTGALSGRTSIAPGISADGMAMDAAGRLWSADCIGGKPVVCFDQDWHPVKSYTFPVYRAISVAFGGPENRTMFIATASDGPNVGEHDGGIFMIETDVPGAPEYILHLAALHSPEHSFNI